MLFMSATHPGVDIRVSAYLQAVLNRNRGSAEQVVREMIEGGARLVEIYGVLGAAQVEVGLLWEKGVITVSDEHFSTEVTVGCIPMAADAFRKFRREPAGFSFLSAGDGEFHVVGLKMLSELLQGEGWETELHLQGPLSSALGELAARRRVDLFCLSATMPSNVPGVVEAARAIRGIPVFRTARILVGGPAFSEETAKKAVCGMGQERTGLIDCLALTLSEALDFSRSISSQDRPDRNSSLIPTRR
jgi:methanogenic corrinoid protein MtbC1